MRIEFIDSAECFDALGVLGGLFIKEEIGRSLVTALGNDAHKNRVNVIRKNATVMCMTASKTGL